MRGLLALICVVSVGCGGRIAPGFELGSDGGSSADGPDAADADLADGGRGPAPVPTCTGKNSECVERPDGTYTGAAIVHCDSVYFVGPWTLLLQRRINNQFQTVQVQVVDKPGFGATFDDATGPPAQLTYRVCTADASGTRCGAPFTTLGPPTCACQAFSCGLLNACDTSADNGCGGTVQCGACPNQGSCNLQTHSCCPIGQESDGTGGCECAPVHPCGLPKYWDPQLCVCALPM